MTIWKKPPNAAEQARLSADLRRDVALRRQGYRDRALQVLPHVCARCGREFSGKRLRELTVHHKDHNFKNNPPDGSNWELLCLYCHDHEHEKFRIAGYDFASRADDIPAPSGFRALENLDSLIRSADKPPAPNPPQQEFGRDSSTSHVTPTDLTADPSRLTNQGTTPSSQGGAP